MEDSLIKFTHTAEVLTAFAIDVRNLYQDNLIKSDRLASGRLLNSVEYETSFKGRSYIVSLKLEDYWKYVEFDTKPHFPPLNQILEWIRVKPILPRPDKNGKLPTPQTLAFLIGRAMAGKSPNQEKLKNPHGGTTGTHDLEKAIAEMNAKYEELLIEAIDKDITFTLRAFIIEPVTQIFSESGNNSSITI